MPRDPMDELIDDLDRVVPPEREQFRCFRHQVLAK